MYWAFGVAVSVRDSGLAGIRKGKRQDMDKEGMSAKPRMNGACAENGIHCTVVKRKE